MNVQDCLNILREIKDVTFSTIDENGFPDARIIDVMLIEEEKLYFCTSRGKDFHKQLTSQNKVAVTGLNSKYQMIRLKGNVHKCENQKYWIDQIFEHNDSMNSVYPGNSRYILDAFYIADGEVEFFDLGVEPINRESFILGNSNITLKGFKITNQCIECGICAKNCPQQCISKGTPYVINESHCLHCGLCYENCKLNAIIKNK